MLAIVNENYDACNYAFCSIGLCSNDKFIEFCFETGYGM